MYRLRGLLACEMSGRVRHEFAKRGWEAWSADTMPASVAIDLGIDKTGVEDSPNEHHYEGDARDLFDWNHPYNAARQREASNYYWSHGQDDSVPLWDLIIAFPPCTDLSYAGNRWRAEKRADGREDAAAKFFMEMYNAPSPHVAVENPRGVMFSRFRQPDQVIQPYYFGEPFRKTTCLWTRGLPRLMRTDEIKPESTVTSGDMKGYRFGAVVTQGSNYVSRFGNGANHYEDSMGRKNRAIVRSLTFPGVARAMASQWGSYVEERVRE